jgi:hypothetical protein
MKTITNYKPRKYKDSPIAFFHYWDAGAIQYQGMIKELTKERTGTVMFFDWLCGMPNDEATVTRAFFDNCTLYDSDYQMRAASKHTNSMQLKQAG